MRPSLRLVGCFGSDFSVGQAPYSIFMIAPQSHPVLVAGGTLPHGLGLVEILRRLNLRNTSSPNVLQSSVLLDGSTVLVAATEVPFRVEPQERRLWTFSGNPARCSHHLRSTNLLLPHSRIWLDLSTKFDPWRNRSRSKLNQRRSRPQMELHTSFSFDHAIGAHSKRDIASQPVPGLVKAQVVPDCSVFGGLVCQ